MSTDNQTTQIGHVVRDVELRWTPGGQTVGNFSIAVNRRWMNKQTQEWEEATSFFDVTCWDQLAENVAESVAKGTRVVVVGRLDQRSWETQDGEKRSKVEITAADVAPSLRWATAEVTKNDRSESDSYANSGGGRGRSSAPAYSAGEEPFCLPAGSWSDDPAEVL